MTISGKCLCGSIEVLRRGTRSNYCLLLQELPTCHGARPLIILLSLMSAKVVTGRQRPFMRRLTAVTVYNDISAVIRSPIYSVTTSYPGVKIWKAGLFADYDGMEIVTNIWCDSAPTWASIDKSIPSHAKARQ